MARTATSRRDALRFGIAAAAAGTAPIAAASAEPDADAELVGLCDEIIERLKGYEACESDEDEVLDAIWKPIRALEDRIEAIEATSTRGLLAKARIARWWAEDRPAGATWDDSCAAQWTGQVVKELLAIHGDKA
ncbi:hypothetical protein [Roseicella frigidaeris]|uniref:Uncharacterized protein n=1 Tax=Roseicella frigidaeris TaxID=2230885 RepID=A0A327LZ14_9PROT|nr:hypothetical protein [Roseicella frigidaeris]RAI55909.1 hypothetical protein DOO78_23455 [Roseicella frigidaeris]